MGKTKIAKAERLNFWTITHHKFAFINLSLLLLLLVLTVSAYVSYTAERIIPKTYIGNIDVSLLTKTDAYQKINSDFTKRANQEIGFQNHDANFNIDLSSASPVINFSKALDLAFNTGHTGTIQQQLKDQILTLFNGQIISPNVSLSISDQIENIAKQIDQQPQDATVWLDEKNLVHTKESLNGIALDRHLLLNQINNFIIFGRMEHNLPIKNIAPSFTTLQAQNSKQALENVQKNPIKLKTTDQERIIDIATLFHLLKIGNTSFPEEDSDPLLDTNKVNTYLKDLALEIDHPVQEPLFKFDSSNKRVSAFRPGKPGSKLNIEEARSLITKAITGQTGNEINLPIEITQPKIKNSAVNNLGVDELIGKGTSNFAGSIENRIYNVRLTAARINGILIPPGETFSFNNTVGEISGATGFKQAYVIKSGRTVLDDGGGVCQVSTTLFRAALNAGLPIIDRTAHAYRVGYYEQGFPPGIDATIFYPSVDFKFKNDTPGHILIQAYGEGTFLAIDLYGTSDGRTTETTKPLITDQTPPPPELRQDDPTLPKGQIKQVDWAAWGARVSFKRTVTKNGAVVASETWRSNYRPWQAIYLVGTQ